MPALDAPLGPHSSNQTAARDPRAKDSLFTAVTYRGHSTVGLKAHTPALPTGKLPLLAAPQHSTPGDHTAAPRGPKAASTLAP